MIPIPSFKLVVMIIYCSVDFRFSIGKGVCSLIAKNSFYKGDSTLYARFNSPL